MRGPGAHAARSVRRIVAGVAVVAFLAALPGAWVRATYGARLSGDEPHYMLTTVSLAEDGDLDTADERADERYRPFHEARLPTQARRLDDGRMVVPHDPLLPALLTVPWLLGGWLGAKIALAALAGVLAGLSTWVAIRRLRVRPAVAATTVGLLAAAWPLSAYATQVYPELPAALAVVGLVAVGTGRPSRVQVGAVVVLVTALPWLAVKYVPVAATITLVLLVRWWRSGRPGAVAATIGLLAGSGVAYLLAHQAWYGGWTVYAAADHFVGRGELAVIGFSPDPVGRSRRLIGLLVGRDFGLAAWQPLWLLLPAALAVVTRRRPAGWDLVVWPLVAGWLTATFVALTMQGWWVPGRQVVVVLPLGALALAWWLDRASGRWRAAALVLGTAGVVTYAWLVVDGLAGRLTWIVDFATVGDPLLALRRAVLPDYLDVTAETWWLHAAWIAVAAGLTVAAWRTDGAGPAAGPAPSPDRPVAPSLSR